jgi:hypothetical protein
MSEPKNYELPTPTASDKAYAIARAAVGSIPIVGSAAVELLFSILAPPFEKRRSEWM